MSACPHGLAADGVRANGLALAISIAFSPDGLEMFVGGHRDTDVIDRYKPAVTATGSTDGWAETATFSTGSSLGAILIIP